MHCSYAIMSPSDTSLEEEKEADVDEAKQDGAKQDGAKREGGATESICCDLNCASLRLMVVVSMAHMIEKRSNEEKEWKNNIKSV